MLARRQRQSIHPTTSRRGVSLIEVVMASLLLAILTTAIVSAITTVVTADIRNRQKLEALELANRLLLQYLDDDQAMPSDTQHIMQGNAAYRWKLQKTPVKIEMPDDSLLIKATDGPGSKAMEKTTLLSVNVYAGIPDGMGGYAEGQRLCTVSRYFHPMSVFYRNPDALSRLTNDPARMMEIMQGMLADAQANALLNGTNNTGTSNRTNGSAAAGGGGTGKPATSGASRGGTVENVFSGSRTTSTRETNK